MTSLARFARLALLIGACQGLAPAVAHANFVFTVSIDSQVLVDKSATLGPYDAEFSFFGSAGNTITISDFNLDGGGPLGPASAVGTASGDLGSSVTISDDAMNFGGIFDQQFTAGSVFSFVVSSTTNLPTGSNPVDAFSFAILDNTFTALSTTAPDGSNALVEYSIDSSANILAFNTNSPEMGDQQLAPQVTPEAAAVPEPASFVLACLGALG